MKRVMTLATLALAVALSTMSFAQQQGQSAPQQQPASQGQSAPQQQPSQAQSPADAPSQVSSSQPFTLTGTVVKEGDKYVLQSAGMSYQLDDQDKAKKFEGQRVSVNGDLDQSAKAIRVSDIAPVK